MFPVYEYIFEHLIEVVLSMYEAKTSVQSDIRPSGEIAMFAKNKVTRFRMVCCVLI